MLSEKNIFDFLYQYCKANGLDYYKAKKQLHAIGKNSAILCVSNPDSPKAEGLKNDINTRMLPTLYIARNAEGNLYAKRTPITQQYLG